MMEKDYIEVKSFGKVFPKREQMREYHMNIKNVQWKISIL